jgi:hypothetical protein
MKWAIDKIENNLALLENIETGEKKEVPTSLLPINIKEGSLLLEKENTYTICLSDEEKRSQEITQGGPN